MNRHRSLTLGTCRFIAAFLAVVTTALRFSTTAHSQQAEFHIYGAGRNSNHLTGECMLGDQAGFLYLCTEHGLALFDGREFRALGAEQGLPSGRVLALALASSGRLVVRYEGEIAVADLPASLRLSPVMLHFRQIPISDVQDAYSDSLAPWHDGVAILDAQKLDIVSLPSGKPASIKPLPLPRALQTNPQASVRAIFNIDGDLWMTRVDGAICAWSTASRCFGPNDGLPKEDWTSITKGPSGAILARSLDLFASLAPGQAHFAVSKLPNQGGAYVSYPENLALFHMPNGNIVTQAARGLEILHDGSWHLLTSRDGVPEGIITSSLLDRSGSLWLQLFGQGVARQVGAGNWQRLTHADGLSDGLAWMTARAADGSVWVSTDADIDQIVQNDGRLSIRRRIPGGAFAIGTSAGMLWTSNGDGQSYAIDPATGARRVAPVQSAVLAVVPGGPRTTWLATKSGIYRCDGVSLDAISCQQIHPGLAKDMIADGNGGFFYVTRHQLRHLAASSADTEVVEQWPVPGFIPVDIAHAADDSVWVGGEGGLFRVWMRNSAPALLEMIPQADLGSSSIIAVMVDHRGWLWAGTTQGLSVFDGHRWITLTTEDGLLSDDLDQRGLREDPDGSIWITFSAGVSHLLHPEEVFAHKTLDVVVSRASLDGQLIKNSHLPFNRKPLLIEVGTPASSAEQSVAFRYRLSGVDEDWLETNNERIFYPFVPPGSHRFEVYAFDRLKHLVSAPQSLVIDIAYPWWRQWWAETLWALSALTFVYGLIRLRVLVERARQAELERRVEEVTAEIRQAQATLAFQATHDQLTGLLNRSEVETRSAGFLRDADGIPEIVVGLVDIDHFKAINDSWGHLTGDAVLREMGALTAGTLRADEFAGRYGGEEILVVLRNEDGRAVSRLAAFHHRVRDHGFAKAGAPGVLAVTCSIGLAAVFRGDNWETLIGRADRALYHAKRSGRDRIAGLAEAASLETEGVPERTRLGDAT